MALVGLLVLAPKTSARAQAIFDLSGAWGSDEHTIDAGVGWAFANLSVLGGGALVERGLDDLYEWTADRTGVVLRSDHTQVVDPRDARTDPAKRLWARIEYQPQWWGIVGMWDPRMHFALGAFGSVHLTARSELVGELRWVNTLGHDLSIRLRWR